MMRSSIENICSFYKEQKCTRKIFIVFITLSILKKTSNVNTPLIKCITNAI